MPKSQKPIIAIISSPNLKHIDLNRFIDFDHIGAVVSGGETSIDSIIEHWTKQYKKEWICYLPQEILYKESAIDHRNQDMINFCLIDNDNDKNNLRIIIQSKGMKLL